MPGSDLRRAPALARFAVRRAREVYVMEGTSGIVRRGRKWWRRRRALERQTGLPGGRVLTSARSWPLSVLAVVEASLPQCYHYRVAQKREILEGLGVPFTDLTLDDPGEVRNRLQLAGLLIVYRLGDSPVLEQIIAEAQRLAIPVLYDVDDLVHDKQATAANPNLNTLPADLRAAVINGAEGYAQALERVDANIASTAELAADMSSRNGRAAFVVENGIDAGMLAIERRLRDQPQGAPTPTVLYGSGSRAHDLDFAQAADGLADFLRMDASAQLHLVGPVYLPEVLEPFAGQVLRTPGPMPYEQYLGLLRSSTVTIAPLVDDHFNRFKSQVKYLEAALVGTPLIASPTVYEDYVQDGVTGLLAGPEDWGTALRRLAGDAELRLQLAANAREDVRRWELPNRPTAQMQTLLHAMAPLQVA